ncbi:MAG TPA: hypothetical protein VHM19_15215 [Polyangiales bacterium]|jgi:hypothetical protein|nr:hypothetical protein [Polyangiales bacterium]
MTTSRAIAKLAHKKCVEEARRGDVVLMDALREIATAAEHCEAVWTNVHNKLVLIAKEQGVSGWGER